MKKTITLLLIVNSLNLFSQNVELNLSESIQKALDKDKNIKSAEYNLENAKLSKKQAFKSGLPSISYSVATTPDSEFSQVSLTAKQTIFDGLKTFIAIKNSGKYLETNEYLLENTKNSTELTVINYYVAILKLQKQLEILNNSKGELESNYKRVQRLYELNLITKTEVLDLNYSMIDLESSIIQVENSLEIAKLNLKNITGISKSDEINLEEIKELELNVPSIDFNEDIETAKQKSLASKIAKNNMELKKALEGTERANLMPRVDLAVLYGNVSPVKGNLPNAVKEDNMNWLTTISVTGTLFDWGKNKNAYDQTKNNTKIANEEEKEAQESIEVNLTKAYLELIRLEKLEEAKVKAVENSSENYKLQKQKYENQLINAIDFLNSENSLRQSEIALSSTKLDLYVAYKTYLNLLK